MNEVIHGFVYFIGAGPGDPGLLTVRGQQILNDADVIIYDRLVSLQILQLLPDDTPKICAEALPGCHPERMQVLVDLMVDNATKGLKVARLKGGDPLLFGRGSEEIEPLIAKNIAFEIVPGVTAALGASAYSGIPLTHREFSSAVAFITGHEKAGKPDSFLHWPEIAKLSHYRIRKFNHDCCPRKFQPSRCYHHWFRCQVFGPLGLAQQTSSGQRFNLDF